MSIAKRLGGGSGWMAAAALSLAGCANEEARSPEPALGEAAAVEAGKPERSAEEGPRSAAERPAGEGSAAAPGGGEEAEAKPGGSGKTAKLSAPVQVAAKVRPGAAELEVMFGSDGSDVSVKVWGTDGLKVKSAPEPVSGASVSKGQTLKVSVLFEAPPGPVNLAVGVNGMFGGKSQGRVQSFTVNPSASTPTGATNTSSETSEATGTAKDSGGRRVKVMKAP